MVNIQFDVPKDMMELAKSPEIQKRPYDLCLKCPFMRDTCDGPNVLSMEYPRWVEWANERAKQIGLTRADIAEISLVPKGTVDTALSGRNADIRTATMRDITKALIGGCWGKYPCHFAALLMRGELKDASVDINSLRESLLNAEKELSSAKEENAELREKLKSADERGAAAVEKAEADAQKKIEWLKNDIAEQRKEKRFLRAVAITLSLFLILLFTVDLMVGTVGWFRF